MRDGTEGAHRLLGESLDRTGGSTKTRRMVKGWRTAVHELSHSSRPWLISFHDCRGRVRLRPSAAVLSARSLCFEVVRSYTNTRGSCVLVMS